MKRLILLICLIISGQELLSCTLFFAAGNDKILCAKNMDWYNTDARMLFIPAAEGKYGRVYFGVAGQYGFTNTSGMNEAGLWYGGASLPIRTDVYNTYNKPRFDYELIEKVMEECATVEEAIAIFSEYWEPHWNGHSLLADRNGNCVVIAYGEDDVEFIQSDKSYQVITNFYLADTSNARWYQCHRYEQAVQMLDSSNDITFSLFRDIADQTHAGGWSHPTVLTNIHDLISGNIQLYCMHNYHEIIQLNLYDELSKGEHYLKCSDYFNKIKLYCPENNTSISSREAKFVWAGESEQYKIRYSKNEHFIDYEEVISPNMPFTPDRMDIGWSLIFIPLTVSLFFSNRRNIGLICLILFSSTSCEKQIIEPQYSNNLHEFTISGLDDHSTYYWKIVGTEGEYINESVVWKFYTD